MQKIYTVKNEDYGVMNFNNMIPVNENKKELMAKADKLYNLHRIKKLNSKTYSLCNNFKLLEEKCLEWSKLKEIEKENKIEKNRMDRKAPKQFSKLETLKGNIARWCFKNRKLKLIEELEHITTQESLDEFIKKNKFIKQIASEIGNEVDFCIKGDNNENR